QQARQIEELHRGAILKAELLRVNNALLRLTELIYAPSDDGEFDNVDPTSGRILIAKPWGSEGWRHFKLSRRKADILRHCLMHKRPSKRPVLYFYDAGANDWYADLASYPTLQAAMFWVKHEQIDLAEWRQAGNEVRKQAATRRQ
ncbi:MAG TPA: hypothetical protein PKE45_07100, partial [Caldilineaceae bacterium]|nr:hypothetical protein [Caldilineaceae bacterium]